ncbi:MAG: leucine-rich repeat domain-containing protein, partial [Clostridia bacterium]|nr:leucine-rich repeat domain-containing protein [Clostridia bacterium]
MTIPSSVTSVGAFAFSGCKNLSALYIEDVVSWCGVSLPNSTANPLSFAGNLYVGGELVSSLVIPEGVVSVAPYTFYGCTSITSVTVPSTVTAMGSEAFSDCSSLEGVYAASISSWCAMDFDGYRSNHLREAGNLYTGGALVTSLDSLEGAEKIGAYALYGCTSLTSAKILSSVLSLGEYSFCGCSSLVFVSVPGSVEEVSTYSFSDCTALESVILGEGVKALRICSFSGCISLESVVIPVSMETVGEWAFDGCNAYVKGIIKCGQWGALKNHSETV